MNFSEITNGNQRKMNNLRRSSLSSMWFNCQLFTRNARPLKFHLDGYTPTEFHRMVDIIEAYGGRVSNPDAADTVIFCQSDRRPTTNHQDRYDMKYFYDSIVALQLQELEKYRLHTSQTQQIPNGADGSSSSERDKELCNGAEESFIKPGTSSKSPRSIIHLELQSNHPCNDLVDLCSSDSEDLSESPGESKSVSRAAAEPKGKVGPCLPKSSTDVECLNENSMAGSSITPRIGRRNYCQDEVDENNSAVSNPTDGTRRPKRKRGYDKDAEFIPPRSVLIQYKKKKNFRTVQFSEEDNEIIINWIKGKNVMPMYGKKIWKDFINEQVLGDRTLSPTELLSHYINKIRKHPTYVKYLEDVKFSGRTLEPATGKNPPYTEEENRAIIKYVIDNDIIPRGYYGKIWIDCLRACKSSLHPKRTPRGLYFHFRMNLCMNYVKYTDEPQALQKFAKTDPSKNVVPLNSERINST